MNYNPADHYVHVLAVSPGREVECRAKVEEICERYEQSDYGEAVRSVFNLALIDKH
jgi:hypothetical protein